MLRSHGIANTSARPARRCGRGVRRRLAERRRHVPSTGQKILVPAHSGLRSSLTRSLDGYVSTFRASEYAVRLAQCYGQTTETDPENWLKRAGGTSPSLTGNPGKPHSVAIVTCTVRLISLPVRRTPRDPTALLRWRAGVGVPCV